jgi:hypothetical protein
VVVVQHQDQVVRQRQQLVAELGREVGAGWRAGHAQQAERRLADGGDDRL